MIKEEGKVNFIFPKATSEDIPALLRLVETVWENMEHKEWFALDDAAAYMNGLLATGKGRIWKAIDRKTCRLAGLYAITCPGTDSDNLGYELELPETDLLQVVHMDAVVVDPLYRGCGIQRKLTDLAEQEFAAEGYRYFMCTIHPDNIYSKNNMEKSGYRVVKKVFKYGGLPRLILLKTEIRSC